MVQDFANHLALCDKAAGKASFGGEGDCHFAGTLKTFSKINCIHFYN